MQSPVSQQLFDSQILTLPHFLLLHFIIIGLLQYLEKQYTALCSSTVC